MSAEFSFPTLPQPAASTLPNQNPLLAKATVVDRSSSSGAAAPSAAASATAANGAAAGVLEPPRQAEGSAAEGPQQQQQPRLAVQPRQRRKVMFEIGYSQVDWVRLTQTHPDLAGLKGQPRRRDITLEEVAQHASEGDAWTVLRGRVYNITPYLRFHPGGVPLLMKAAGRDGTALFNKYHAWVNAEFMLEKCLVGFLKPGATEQQQQQQQQQQGVGGSGPSAQDAGSMPPPPPVAR